MKSIQEYEYNIQKRIKDLELEIRSLEREGSEYIKEFLQNGCVKAGWRLGERNEGWGFAGTYNGFNCSIRYSPLPWSPLYLREVQIRAWKGERGWIIRISKDRREEDVDLGKDLQGFVKQIIDFIEKDLAIQRVGRRR